MLKISENYKVLFFQNILCKMMWLYKNRLFKLSRILFVFNFKFYFISNICLTAFQFLHSRIISKASIVLLL
jgi:hypothetical protein